MLKFFLLNKNEFKIKNITINKKYILKFIWDKT